MSRHIALLLLFLAALNISASTPAWVQVQSPHFTLITDANDKQGVHVLDQLERMRWVFQTLFPSASVDPAAPITVIAVKNKQDFAALEPEAYLAKGQISLEGLFLSTQDKNYILLRLDAENEQHPYAIIYHEYTHFQLRKDIVWLPLWLNEGLAEFFQNTDIHDKDVQLGEPSYDDLLYLRQNRIIPLPILLRVDATSPYYHEEQKGSIFYAESWALTHFLEISDRQNNTHRLTDYAERMNRHEDPVTAAQEAFGDLRQLQKALEAYIAQSGFKFFRMSTAAAPINDASFKITPLAQSQADAIRADFLVCNQRTSDARILLASVLQQDPNNVLANETMGYIEFAAGNREAARKWYEQAVKLDSQSYLAHYYYAAMTFDAGIHDDAQIESSLKTAIKLNPQFAPPYDLLALFYGTRDEKLSQAHILNSQAISLEPGEIRYRLNAANILLKEVKPDDALRVLKQAVSTAKTPEEVDEVQNRIKEIEQDQAVRDHADHPTAASTNVQTILTPKDLSAPPTKHPTEEPHGPKHLAKGVIHNVECDRATGIELKVEGSGPPLSLYTNNYLKVEFTAANFTPTGEIHPCTDLEGMKARVQYVQTSDKSIDGQILWIELSK
jgi:Tfp pilus assembly protein PilF